MEKYKLTAEEWFVVQLLILANPEEGKLEYLHKYLQITNGGNIRDVIISLLHKSVITTESKILNIGEVLNPDDIVFNQLFLKSFYKCSGKMGFELFEAYPPYIDSCGVRYTLNNITKGYKGMEDLCYDYGRIIKFNPSKHREIMNLLEFAKEHNLLSYGIVEFIKSYKWLTIQKIKDEGSYIGTTFDTVTSI